MKYKVLAEYLQKLENTAKRLEITDILTDLIRDFKTSEADIGIYLILGYLKAPYENPKFNVAEKMMIKTLEYTFSTVDNPRTAAEIDKMYNKIGDLGDVTYELAKDGSKSTLTVEEVHKMLLEIAKIEGTGSQEAKIRKTAVLLKQLDKLSAKYTVRIILGTIRLGFTELTLVDALAKYINDKNSSKYIENIYNVHPDIGLITKRLVEKGLKGLDDIKIETGVPVLSQKAQRVKDAQEAISKMGNIWAEYKFDGTRVQLHIDRNKNVPSNPSEQDSLFANEGRKYLIKTYTRNLEETTHQFPDITSAADLQVNAKSAILDGEAIGFNRDTGDFLTFQETMQRKRKHDISSTANDIPLKYFVFDILYLNGKPLVQLPLRERKELLKKTISEGDTIIVDEYLETNDPETLEEYFELAEKKGLEGLIVKKPEDSYQAGARSYSWIKLKKADKKLLDDSVDCVVLGYYAGRGNRSKFGIGGFLVGVYDKKSDSFKTISKIGTGLTEDDWIKLKGMCDKHKINKIPSNVDISKNFYPDVIVRPEIVVEIGADEISESPSHSAKYALRFPRLIKFREDKNAVETTSLDEIKNMHEIQKKGHY